MRREILEAAVDALHDGRDPFSDHFLIENDVTYDECMQLGDSLAAGLMLLMFVKDNPEAVSGAVNSVRMKQIREELSRL